MPRNIRRIHVQLKDLRLDGGTQQRVQMREDVIEKYLEGMRAGDTFPPVVVFDDGSSDWLADGFYRYQAAQRIGWTEILAEVHEGTQRDAILYSVGVNEKHGQNRTQEDKRRAIETLLKDSEWGVRSDSWVAKTCNVNDKTVAQVRNLLQREGATETVRETAPLRKSEDEVATSPLQLVPPPPEGIPPKEVEFLRGGKVHKMDVSRIGKRKTATAHDPIRRRELQPVTDAMDFATIAISQLQRIRTDDPNESAALLYVREWIDRRLGQRSQVT